MQVSNLQNIDIVIGALRRTPGEGDLTAVGQKTRIVLDPTERVDEERSVCRIADGLGVRAVQPVMTAATAATATKVTGTDSMAIPAKWNPVVWLRNRWGRDDLAVCPTGVSCHRADESIA